MFWQQWWFWLVVIVILIPVLVDSIENIIGLFRGDPEQVEKLKEEIVGLKHELAQAEADKKAYELQKELEKEDRQRIKRQSIGQEVAVIGFCDLVGFTRFINSHGDEESREVLKGYNNMVRSVLDAFNGLEVKQLGDGFLFSFDSSRKALDAALNIREGIKRLNSKQETDLSIRIGLHAGEVIREDGDVIGSTVNMAERIMSEASADQIVTSETFKSLAGTPGKFDFVEIGDRELKGFTGRKKIYEVSPAADESPS